MGTEYRARIGQDEGEAAAVQHVIQNTNKLERLRV